MDNRAQVLTDSLATFSEGGFHHHDIIHTWMLCPFLMLLSLAMMLLLLPLPCWRCCACAACQCRSQ